ncbi:hypothetical protein A4H34_01665 [Peptidiphaga gingivicola]|uniref:Uncharacterized protein n=1 Tax=Peptidiphaga gingivicola TaxID=2741497 RepID=A0A179B3G8_9ACTO|nr:hypothetical protein A4H34_01665 [Peptidiphaga gingivicola]
MIFWRLSASSYKPVAIPSRILQAALAVPPSKPRSEATARLMAAISVKESLTEENKPNESSIALVRQSSIPCSRSAFGVAITSSFPQ